MKKKHKYIKLKNVSSEFEKFYNKVARQEEYRLEKDPLGSALLFGNEDDLHKYKIVDYINAKENEQIENKRRKEYLDKALAELKENYPLEHKVFTSRYSPEKELSVSQIAKEIGRSNQMVYFLLKKSKVHLQSLVNKYKNNC